MRAQAVAENQPVPGEQNRMTTELSKFAARLRGLIRHADFPASAFEAQALELFTLQFQHNATYRRICEARRVSPRAVTGWQQIPAVPAAAFKELELTALPPAERTHVFHSSGTTGQRPSRHFHSTASLALYEASLLGWFRRHRGRARRLLALAPPAAQVPHSSLVHMFETIRRHEAQAESVFVGRLARDGGWEVDGEAAVRILREVCASPEPLLILGTAFSFVHLLDVLADGNQYWKLPAGSAALETGGYKGRSRNLPKAELYEMISERLGLGSAQIICEYGMSELSSQAYDLSLARDGNPLHSASVIRRFQFPPWARVQVISPETGDEVADGETGLLRIYDLANVFSVLAIQTEELAIRRGEGFELIGRAQLAEPRGCSLMAV